MRPRGIENLVLELKKEGKTILITSHILSEAEKMCDSVALIKEGRLVAFGQSGRRQEKIHGALDHGAVPGQAKYRESGADHLRRYCQMTSIVADDRLTVHVSDPDRLTPVMNKKLVEADIPVLEIRTRESSLDDVYFKALEE